MKTLTNREKQVLHQLAVGSSQKEIADELNISVFTVDVHLKHIKEKTGLHKATELTAFWWVGNYSLPVFDLPERLRQLIGAALLALTFFGFYVNNADFIRVRTQRAPIRTVRTARRGGKRNKSTYKLTA